MQPQSDTKSTAEKEHSIQEAWYMETCDGRRSETSESYRDLGRLMNARCQAILRHTGLQIEPKPRDPGVDLGCRPVHARCSCGESQIGSLPWSSREIAFARYQNQDRKMNVLISTE